MTEQEKAIIRQMATYIELGSQGKQQITGQWISDDQSGCCAMGAIFIGCEILKQKNDVEAYTDRLKRKLHIAWFPNVIYPADVPYWRWIHSPTNVTIEDAIICLNDYAGWSFSRIVEWMRSIAE